MKSPDMRAQVMINGRSHLVDLPVPTPELGLVRYCEVRGSDLIVVCEGGEITVPTVAAEPEALNLLGVQSELEIS